MSSLTNFLQIFSSKNKEGFFTKLATKLGDISSKSFYFLNSYSNFKRRINVKDYLSASGFALEMIISPIVKGINLFLYRGLSVGLYMFANGVKDAIKKTSYKDLKDHLNHLVLAIKKGIGYLNKDFIKNFRSPDTGLQSMLAGAFLFIGPIIWKLTGNKLLGTSIRNLGAITQDISQLKVDYIFSKQELKSNNYKELLLLALQKSLGIKQSSNANRPYYFKSGLGYVVGTLFDWTGRLFEALGLGKNAVMVPTSLTYIFDGIGAFLLGISQDKEIGKKVIMPKAA